MKKRIFKVFAMLGAMLLSAAFMGCSEEEEEAATQYSIIVSESGGCTIEASHEKAEAGTLVSVTVTPGGAMNSCREPFSVKAADGTVPAVTKQSDYNFSFTMPGQNVYLQAEWVCEADARTLAESIKSMTTSGTIIVTGDLDTSNSNLNTFYQMRKAFATLFQKELSDYPPVSAYFRPNGVEVTYTDGVNVDYWLADSVYAFRYYFDSKVKIDLDLSGVTNLDAIPNLSPWTYDGISRNEYPETSYYIDTGYEDYGAFSNLLNLNSVILPRTVEKIEEGAFYNSGIESVDMPDTVSSMGYEAFGECRKLKKIQIPNSLTEIPFKTFDGCVALANVVIPTGVTSIGDYAFRGCPIKSLEIPTGVTSIGMYAFRECPSLESLEIPTGVTSIGYGAFMNSPLKSLKIPDTVTEIGSCAFKDTGLTSVEIPYGVTQIEQSTFSGCEKLSSVSISSSVESIKRSAFNNCERLKSITIPESVHYIAVSAFLSCDNLSEIVFSDTSTKWQLTKESFTSSGYVYEVFRSATLGTQDDISVKEPSKNAEIMKTNYSHILDGESESSTSHDYMYISEKDERWVE
mgnify:CR=1 FL=1